MRVTSPVGEFPFAIKRIAVDRRSVRIIGSMGRWPATVELQLSDLAQPPVAVGLTAVAAALLGAAWLALRALRSE